MDLFNLLIRKAPLFQHWLQEQRECSTCQVREETCYTSKSVCYCPVGSQGWSNSSRCSELSKQGIFQCNCKTVFHSSWSPSTHFPLESYCLGMTGQLPISMNLTIVSYNLDSIFYRQRSNSTTESRRGVK
ncbi:uncharacterized protein LOC113306872 [Papaver somniferum]|uniref:uncharacterized protein LOC113306872 n=1 Tax=Papaver somniferum TaxID=3469 RepID=UPI000E705D0C|nr:uncharacterized protein LOC113306872 [Papaver somniferum]